MIQRNPNRSIFTIIFIARLCYAFWSWIKPSLTLPSHAVNYTKKHILIISKILVIISSLILPLHLSLLTLDLGPKKTPVILVIDQSRSMAHNDLIPSRRSVATQIANALFSLDKGRWSQTGGIITYAQTPQIHNIACTPGEGTSVPLDSRVTTCDSGFLQNIQPIISQQGSSALGDAWLIAYDQIGSGLNYKPIVITITDGGSNTGYDLSQTASILKTRAQLWIIGLSTGTQIVAYDDQGRGLTSTMDAALLSSLADSGHRYSIPNDASISGAINKLSQDLHSQYYNLGPMTYDLGPILWILLGLGITGWGGIYLTKTNNHA